VHLLHSSDFDTAHHLKLQVTLAAPDGRERDECCMQGETALVCCLLQGERLSGAPPCGERDGRTGPHPLAGAGGAPPPLITVIMRSSFMARGISVLLLVVCGGSAAAAMADGAAVASEPHSQMQVGSSQHTGQDLSWAFLERLLGEVTELRGEVRALKADRLRANERFAALEQWQEELRQQTTTTQEDAPEVGDPDSPKHAEPDSHALQEQTEDLARHVEELTAAMDACCPVRSRRMQTGDGQPQQAAGVPAENAQIIKRNVTRRQPTGGTHHRMQTADGYGPDEGRCNVADLPTHTDAITAECCDEPSEDCTGGYPHSCNAACAAIFLPFWEECRSALGQSSSHFEPTVALCEAAMHSAPSLAEQLNVECSDGTATSECVPECTESYHGFLMLISIDGDDSKLSCELNRGLYSWVGSAVSSQDACLPIPVLRYVLVLIPTRWR
jgi:hypothetical protein